MTQHLHLSPDSVYPFDARGVLTLPPCGHLRRARQPTARRDHALRQRPDPLPLLSQIAQRYGDRVGVEYRQRRPGAIVIDFSVR